MLASEVVSPTTPTVDNNEEDEFNTNNNEDELQLDLQQVEQYIGRGFFQYLFQQHYGVDEDDEEEEESESQKQAFKPLTLKDLEKYKLTFSKKKKGNDSDDEEEEEYDYYRLLELPRRWLSNKNEIRKAYKKKVKQYHPDHQKDIQDDSLFKILTKGYEILMDDKKKVLYDSSEKFDESVPTYFVNQNEDETIKFFKVFSPVFERWSKWSRAYPNVPKLGDMNTSYEDVEKFYNFWFAFKSWRDYGFELNEYNEDQADSGAERRWIRKENEKLNSKRKKQEKAKINEICELAKKNDPRIKRKLEEEIKLKKQREEEARLREIERIVKEEELRQQEEERKKQLEREEKERKQKEREEYEKRMREQQAILKRMRELCSDYILLYQQTSKKASTEGKIKAEDLEFLLSNLPFDKVEQANIKLAPLHEEAKKTNNPSVFVKAFYEIENKVREIVKKKEEEKKQQQVQQEKEKLKKASAEWTSEELTLLAKGVGLFPGGTPQRWQRIAEYIGTNKTPEEVQIKTTEIRKRTSLGEVPKREDKDYFNDFQKKKEKTQTAKKKEEEEKEKGSSSANESGWSAQQQKELENGIRQHKNLKGDEKWQKIAEMVNGKTADECKERFEYCRQLALAKKNQQK
ncbi:hypothetical protein ABK040_015079 [Willaertia magna]